MAASERVVVLMSPTEKAALEKKARQLGTSVGELVRRSVDAYGSEIAAEDAEALLKVFEETHARTLEALGKAERELDRTLAYFAAKRRRA